MKYLFEQPTNTRQGDIDTKAVQRALWIMQKHQEVDSNGGGIEIFGKNAKPSRIDEYKQIEDDYNNAGSTQGKRGAHWAYSKKTYNVVSRVVNRWQLPKYAINYKKTQKQEDIEMKKVETAIIKAGVELVLTEGGFRRVFDGKAGAKFKSVLYGDSFILIETTNNKSFPINFRVLPIDKVYINPEAICMRGSATCDDVRQLLYVASYSYDTFRREFKDFGVDDVSWGRLPSFDGYMNSLSRTDEQNSASDDNRIGEIGIFFDLDDESYTIFAISRETIIKQEQGKKYPFKKKKISGEEPYIPIAHLFCSQRASGFYSMGIGHLMSEINQADDFMRNQYILGLMKTVNPIDVLTVSSNRSNQFMMRYQQAMIDVMNGDHGVVMNELDGDGNPLIGNMSKLSSGDIGQSYERFQSVISDRDVVGIGVNEQDVSTPASKTATAVEAEQAAAEAMVQALSEQNAAEIKFIIEVAIDFIRKFVSTKDETPIDTRDIKMPEGIIEETLSQYPPEVADQIRPKVEQKVKSQFFKELTLGHVAELLKNNEVEVTIDIGTGLKATSTRRIQEKRALLELVQGTKAQTKVLQDLSEDMGTPFSASDLQPLGMEQQQQPQQMPL